MSSSTSRPVLAPRMAGPLGSPALGSDSLHFLDAADFSDCPHHTFELVEIGNIEGEGIAGSAVVTGTAVCFTDIQPQRAEHLADDCENAG